MLASLFPRAHARYRSLPIVGGVLDGLCVWLFEQGYPPLPIQRRMQAAKLLASALCQDNVHSVRELTAPSLRSYAPPPQSSDSPMLGALVRSLVQYLEERGDLKPTPRTPTQCRVAEYARYLVRVRGLSEGTISVHTSTINNFLLFVDHDTHPQRFHCLGGDDVEAFIAKTSERVGRGRLGSVTSALRAYLRFLSMTGDAPPGLDAQVESPRIYRDERLPRTLPWDVVLGFLRSIDRTTPKGQRDYALFLLIATYGLRASEVRSLKLDDISWRTRQIRVPRPKVSMSLLLPLTDEVAASILDYLRSSRPSTTHRWLFLRVVAPIGLLGRTAIRDAFRAWAQRAGIRLPARGGPHCLRHALALHLLRKGAALKTISDVLGHRSVQSTGVYLRVDVDDLRDVALQLPVAAVKEEVQQ